MLAKGSRYEKVAAFAPAAGMAFAGLRPRPIPETPGVVEHVITAADRLDLLARLYYDNDRAWWRIVDANPWLLWEFGPGLENGATKEQERFARHLHLTGLIGRTLVIPKLET